MKAWRTLFLGLGETAMLCGAVLYGTPGAQTPALPKLAVTPPMVRSRDARLDSAFASDLRAALLLGAEGSSLFAVETGEERLPPEEALSPCFDPGCGRRTLRRSQVSGVLLSEWRPGPGPGSERSGELLLALVSAGEGTVRALRRRLPGPDSLIAVARSASQDLLEGRGEISTGNWEQIPWLSDRDTTDHHRIFRYGLLAGLAAAVGVATWQHQWNGNSGVTDPLGVGPDPASSLSSLRGFFSEAPEDAAAQGRAGAGASLSENALAVLLNPAALGGMTRPGMVLARSLSPDGSPRLSAAFATPTRGAWTQGVALYYAGDALASEATLGWGVAYDLAGWDRQGSGIRFGATGKAYLAQAGEDGTGLDRSRGRTTGLGLDLGAVLPLEDRLKVALVLRDLPGFLWHRNDATGLEESETLPPEFRAGAEARATDALEFFLEGHRGLFPDAPVHVHVGAEETLFRVLRARAGYHQIFGDQSVRLFSVGFGLDTRGFRASPSLALQFAFEYGLGDNEALAGSQQFSLEVGF